MNEKRPEPNQRLLHDVLQDEIGTARADSVKQLTLAAYRQGRFRRRVVARSGLAAVVMMLAAGSLFFRAQLQRGPTDRHADKAPVPVYETSAVTPGPSKKLKTLSDEELLASFPPNSCYIAEIDGRTVLVFADATLQKKYLH